MGQATRPVCVWCKFEDHGLPYEKQELALRTINGALVWLHLQCEHIYRELEAPKP
jgi:hypothetical protein